MRIYRVFIALSLGILITGCHTFSISDRNRTAAESFSCKISDGATPWTHLDFLNDSDDFQFVIVSDRTGGNREGVFDKAVEKTNLLRPEFVICVGDLIPGGGNTDRETAEAQWDEFDAIVARLEAPFFYVPGNHDLTNDVMADVWKERYGPAYWHFIYKDVLFLIVNSDDPHPSNISAEQVEYVNQVLEENADVRWTLLFLHRPFCANAGAPEEWDRIVEAIGDRPHSIFAGHNHQYVKYERQGRSYIKFGTTGGTSALKGPGHGLIDHIVWATMTDDGPRLAVIPIDSIYDEDFYTEEQFKIHEAEKEARKKNFPIGSRERRLIEGS